MRERRLAVPPDVARRAAEQATASLLAHGVLVGARRVALYAAFRGELDTRLLARELRARGIATCYPCIKHDRRLFFHEIQDEVGLVPNKMGIPEPTEAHPPVGIDGIDVIVVPGLAFDPRGGRVGWGRAYYDNTLAGAEARRVGFAFELQVVDAVPMGASDERVDLLCTEAGVRETGRVR